MKLLPFSTQQHLVDAAASGIAVSVYVNADDFEPQHRNHYYKILGFSGDEKYKVCTILSEVVNMPGHYVVVGKHGQIVCGLHDDIFYVEDEDDAEYYVAEELQEEQK